MKTFTPDELDKETYLKYKDIIDSYKISNIYLIRDKYDISENTMIDNKIYVTKPLIESLPINEYFTIICMSKPNESCKTYKLMLLEKILEEYNSIRNNNSIIVNESNKIEFHNYGDEEDRYINQELENNYDDLPEDFEHDNLDEMIDKEFNEESEEDY